MAKQIRLDGQGLQEKGKLKVISGACRFGGLGNFFLEKGDKMQAISM